ncbi:hypothetical protein [Pseudomonas sp. lyk4-R2A-10]|uniref:hypothetical protein n=1 Tax=Pseudomonas sp. lyk4-R2A-10 TaxID=3040315 RepID=UPI002554BEFC|nr:hypothetical protein [Pseudomonas sp. lyk4-R2A-10]
MKEPIIEMPQILETISRDECLAEGYLKQVGNAEHLHAIHVGIADADAGKLIDLATVKAKWLSR